MHAHTMCAAYSSANVCVVGLGPMLSNLKLRRSFWRLKREVSSKLGCFLRAVYAVPAC